MHDLKDSAYIQAPVLLYGLVLLLLDELFPCYSIHGLPFLWKLLILLQFVELLLSYLSLSVMTRVLFIRPPVHPESSKLSSVHFVLPATSQTIHLYSLLLPSQGSDSVMLFLSLLIQLL